MNKLILVLIMTTLTFSSSLFAESARSNDVLHTLPNKDRPVMTQVSVHSKSVHLVTKKPTKPVKKKIKVKKKKIKIKKAKTIRIHH